MTAGFRLCRALCAGATLLAVCAPPALANQPTGANAGAIRPTLHRAAAGPVSGLPPSQAAVVKVRALDLTTLDAAAFGDWDHAPQLSTVPTSRRKR